MADLTHNVNHVVLQTLGFVSLACAIMTVSFSLLLVAAFSAHHADLEAQDANGRMGTSATATAICSDVEQPEVITLDVNGAGNERIHSAVNNSFVLIF